MKYKIKDILITCIITLLLIVPLTLFRLDSEGGAVSLSLRPWLASYAVAALIIARYLTVMLLPVLRKKMTVQNFALGLPSQLYWPRWLGGALIILAAMLPLMPFADRGILDVSSLILTYLMLGWGLSIVVGLTGLLDLGYVAFYAIGAYTYALLAVKFGFSFWQALPLSGITAAIAAAIIGLPILRLRGDYFAIVTLGFAEITRIILINWQSVTQGPDGISGIPRPSLFGLATFSANSAGSLPTVADRFGIAFDPLQKITFTYYLLLAFALLVLWLVGRLRRLPIGRAWEAIREDEIAAQALGINLMLTKLAAYITAAIIAGLAGAFFATRQQFISPESFNVMESVTILAIVVLGGMGSRLGVAIATLFLIGLPELFRELAEYRMLAFGAGLVIIMLWRPQGLLANRQPTIRLTGQGG